MRFFAGMIFALLLVVAAVVALVASGTIDMSAARPPGLLERIVGEALVDRSLARRAPRARNPLPQSPPVIAAGLEHYRRDCAGCHGTPGAAPGPLGRGLNPPPPDLGSADAQESSDGELFYIVSRGVRLTGMPAWGPSRPEREVWELVAFVRHLPRLTPAERQELGEAGRAARQ